MERQSKTNTITIHRLVQAVTRDRLNQEEKEKWAEAAVRLIDEAFEYDKDNVSSWSICAGLLPHAIAVIERAEDYNIAPEETGRLLNEAGLYLDLMGDFTRARLLVERSVKICEKNYEPDHPNIATTLSNLGTILQDLGELKQAKALMQRALDIMEKNYEPDHPKLTITLGNLGGIMEEIGDKKAAITNYRRALDIINKRLGEEHWKADDLRRKLERLGG